MTIRQSRKCSHVIEIQHHIYGKIPRVSERNSKVVDPYNRRCRRIQYSCTANNPQIDYFGHLPDLYRDYQVPGLATRHYFASLTLVSVASRSVGSIYLAQWIVYFLQIDERRRVQEAFPRVAREDLELTGRALLSLTMDNLYQERQAQLLQRIVSNAVCVSTGIRIDH
jgi:hypothetical protein